VLAKRLSKNTIAAWTTFQRKVLKYNRRDYGTRTDFDYTATNKQLN